MVKEVLLRADYALTDLGHAAHQQYLSMMRWAKDATPRIRAARQAYTSATGSPMTTWSEVEPSGFEPA